MIKPYEGPGKYIFISYAHADREDTFVYLKEMQKNGYRIWFDEGIKTGADWAEIIAAHIADCSLFIIFISENCVRSNNCRKELTFALSLKKPVFFVQTETCSLTPGMAMQLSDVQGILKFNYPSPDVFYSKFFNCPPMLDPLLKMGPEEANDGYYEIDSHDTLISELNIAIALIKINGCIVMVKRATKEGKLNWQFPAGIVKPAEDRTKRAVKMVREETGLRTEVVAEVGRRIHPDTKTICYYYAMKYISGELINGDEDENETVKLIPISEYKQYITSDLFENVKNYIEEVN